MQDVNGDSTAVKAKKTGQGRLQGGVSGEDVEGGRSGRRRFGSEIGGLGERKVDVGVREGADGVGDGFLLVFGAVRGRGVRSGHTGGGGRPCITLNPYISNGHNER